MSGVGIVLLLGYTELDKRETVILVSNISQMFSEIILHSKILKKEEGKGAPPKLRLCCAGGQSGFGALLLPAHSGARTCSRCFCCCQEQQLREGSVRALAAATGAALQKWET